MSNDKAGGSLGVWYAGFSITRITHYMTTMDAERMERAAWEVRLGRGRISMMSKVDDVHAAPFLVRCWNCRTRSRQSCDDLKSQDSHPIFRCKHPVVIPRAALNRTDKVLHSPHSPNG